jgi:DNA polymerase
MTGPPDFAPVFTAILSAPDYAAFARLLRDSGCPRCALSAGRTRIVVDRGDPGAGIMAIGEAPGENEDREGRAFVGRAGRLLDELLGSAGIDPGRDLLIANVVKCRPPGNRAPRPEEAAICLPYLRRQIEHVRPHTILLLGATAVRHALQRTRSFTMEREVGKGFAHEAWPGIAFFALYHPAFLLRDPRKKPRALEHLHGVKMSLVRRGLWPPAARTADSAKPPS